MYCENFTEFVCAVLGKIELKVWTIFIYGNGNGHTIYGHGNGHTIYGS